METRSESYWFGLVLGMLVACLFIGGVIWIIGKRYQGSREYDERQKLAQGKAYKLAFFTLLIYLTAGALFDMLTGIRWCDLFTFTFIGVFLSVTVFAVICIAQDAYTPFSQNPKRTIWITGVIGLINAGIGVINCLTPNYMIVDGMLTFHCVNLLCGVLLLGVAAATWVKTSADRRASAEQE